MNSARLQLRLKVAEWIDKLFGIRRGEIIHMTYREFQAWEHVILEQHGIVEHPSNRLVREATLASVFRLGKVSGRLEATQEHPLQTAAPFYAPSRSLSPPHKHTGPLPQPLANPYEHPGEWTRRVFHQQILPLVLTQELPVPPLSPTNAMKAVAPPESIRPTRLVSPNDDFLR